MNPDRKISTAIIAQNEAPRIGQAIRSCQPFSDEILVVDGGSQDATREIAGELGCTVIMNPWPGFAAQRNFAAEKARHDWIFFIDADEMVGEDLARDLRRWKGTTDPGGAGPGGYVVVRVGDFMGRWMAGQELVRLYDRRRHRIRDLHLHEEVDLPRGRAGRLRGTLWHYGYRSLSEHVVRFSGYTEIEAAESVSRGVRFSLARLLIRPPARFFQRYLAMGLFRKGVPGLAASAFWAWFEILRELRIYEAGRGVVSPGKERHEPPGG